MRAALGLHKYDLNDELKLNSNQAFNRQNSEAYFINCWQIYEGETLDMWRTYGNAVAVFSRFDLLKSALSTMLDHILVGIVRYGEKDMTGYNLIPFLYTKQRLFAKERELRVVLKKCRPDWDITTPELKAAWQQRRKELFYPYGRTYAQTLGEQD
ncbi:MAG: hypothetical protein WA175_09205 [Candidatus Acidiferrales bacterium]